MGKYSDSDIVNVGSGQEVSIHKLAEQVALAVGFQGQIRFNTDMPDGTPRKLLDVSRLSGLGWHHTIGLQEGIEKTYAWFLNQGKQLRL